MLGGGPSLTSQAKARRGGGWGVLATIKATAEQTDGRYALVEILAPHGYGSVLHFHHQEDEGFYILEGEMTFYVTRVASYKH
jgi:mannose-6-phosphate isomerase-like protein (cupin superfamily)